MSRNTFYFSHDYNTRSDSKIKNLLFTFGMEGYGIYWSIVEDLYINDNIMPLNTKLISYDLRVSENIVQSIIFDFDLFKINEDSFSSKSVEKRLNERDKKSQVGRDNAKKRWGDSQNTQIANDCIFYIIRIFNDYENFIKCGITNTSVSRRFSGKLNGYEYELVYSIDSNSLELLDLENEISSNFKSYLPKNKFGGYLECFELSELNNIKNFVMQRECKPNAIKERKGKENKVNESIDILLEKETKYTNTDFKNDLINYGFKENLVIEWLQVRKTKKATNSKTAFNKFIKQVELNGNDKNFILETCVAKSWSGFEASYNLQGSQPQYQQQKPATPFDNLKF